MCNCVQKGVPVERHLRHLRSWKQELICPRDTNCPRLGIKKETVMYSAVYAAVAYLTDPQQNGETEGSRVQTEEENTGKA